MVHQSHHQQNASHESTNQIIISYNTLKLRVIEVDIKRKSATMLNLGFCETKINKDQLFNQLTLA